MSDPDATTEIAHWLSDNLADWLWNKGNEPSEMKKFVNRCVLPHLSPYGVNSMYEFLKEDYDDGDLIDTQM